MKQETKDKIKASVKSYWDENKAAIVETVVAGAVVVGLTVAFNRWETGIRRNAHDYYRYSFGKAMDRSILRYKTPAGEVVMLPHRSSNKVADYWTVSMNGAAVSDILKEEVIGKLGLTAADGWTPDLKLSIVDFIALS